MICAVVRYLFVVCVVYLRRILILLGTFFLVVVFNTIYTYINQV
jgi:hypothetical protein